MSTCDGYRLIGCVLAVASNTSIDTDLLSAGFAGLLSADHLQRYAPSRLARFKLTIRFAPDLTSFSRRRYAILQAQ